MSSKEGIAAWCEDNLFGNREVEGMRIPLTRIQKAVQGIAVEIIQKWEARNEPKPKK